MQECSLLDWEGRVCCTIFVEGCNFRCPFCHNPELMAFSEGEGRISERAAIEFLYENRDFLDGVCITGGEPALSDIEGLLESIKGLGMLVKLDTNGSNCERLKALAGKGLIDYFAMDVKSSKERYSELAGAEVDVRTIERSVEFLMSSGLDYEFRTTFVPVLMKLDDVARISEWLEGAQAWALQRFIPENCFDKAYRHLPQATDEEMKRALSVARSRVPNAKVRG